MTTTPIVNFTPEFNTRSSRSPGAVTTTAVSLHSGKEVAAAVGPPVITFGTTSSYNLMYNDKGSGASLDGAFYRPVAPTGWFILGDYCQGNYNDPSMPSLTIQVTNDDPTNPVLAAPTGYSLIWNDKGSGASMDGSIWAPQPPPGYIALGAVSNTGYSPPAPSQLMCIRFDLVQTATMGQLIWDDKGSGAHMDGEFYGIVGLTTFYGQGNYNPPLGPVWIPKALV